MKEAVKGYEVAAHMYIDKDYTYNYTATNLANHEDGLKHYVLKELSH